MELNDFYYFRSRHLVKSFQVTSFQLEKNAEESDPHSDLIQSKYQGINFPIVFKHKSGNEFTDILTTGWTNLFLISNRLKETLTKHHFTGWCTYPIILQDKKGNKIEGYHGLSVSGRSGPIIYKTSSIIEKRRIDFFRLSERFRFSERSPRE